MKKNEKEKIDDEEASAIAYRNLEAESNGKFVYLGNASIGKLEAKHFGTLSKKYKYKTRC